MGFFMEEGRSLNPDPLNPEILAIEARLSAVERHVEALEARKYGPQTEVSRLPELPESKIDRNHNHVMGVLKRLETYSWNQILERIARIESKLQNVA
jgi:hypothetical protein